MDFNQQLIFLLSALGGINGLLLSGYFLLYKKKKDLSDYFLGGLIFMISVRTIKSSFLHFNSHLIEPFIISGLMACTLIGPFLYLYTKSHFSAKEKLQRNWYWHVVPYIIGFIGFRYFYDYYEQKNIWGWFIEGIYAQWFIYIVLSGILLRPIFRKVIDSEKSLTNKEFWLLSIFIGTTLVWLAYETSSYTSYIVGALTFTFLIYISLLLLLYNKVKNRGATLEKEKYASSPLSAEDTAQQMEQLMVFIRDKKPFLDPDLTLSKLSKQMGISSKQMSQIINQNTGENYSQFIAKLRVEEAKLLLVNPDRENQKIAAIAYDCGFNSLSSFNTYFKKYTGQTAHNYRNRS